MVGVREAPPFDLLQTPVDEPEPESQMGILDPIARLP
jgi:hypothetical protein